MRRSNTAGNNISVAPSAYRHVWQVLSLPSLIITLVTLGACDTRPKVCSLSGVAYGPSNVSMSLLSTGGKSAHDDYPRITGVQVYISYDKVHPIGNITAITNENGEYSISVPPEKGNENQRYLIAEKDGYERLVAMIGCGPFSGTTENTIILKKK